MGRSVYVIETNSAYIKVLENEQLKYIKFIRLGGELGDITVALENLTESFNNVVSYDSEGFAVIDCGGSN